MTDQLGAGDVVRCRGNVGVVYCRSGHQLLVFPVAYRQRERAGEIAVDGLVDRITLRVVDHAVICAGRLQSVPVAGQERLGTVSDLTLHDVTIAARHAVETARTVARWRGDSNHRREACRASGMAT